MYPREWRRRLQDSLPTRMALESVAHGSPLAEFEVDYLSATACWAAASPATLRGAAALRTRRKEEAASCLWRCGADSNPFLGRLRGLYAVLIRAAQRLPAAASLTSKADRNCIDLVRLRGGASDTIDALTKRHRLSAFDMEKRVLIAFVSLVTCTSTR
jgi:hypothetical protein